MNCAECEVLLHALIDGELDAGHARDVEAHVATCTGCAEKLKAFRAMREAMASADLKRAAPAHLRSRIEAALPLPAAAAAEVIRPRQFLRPSRRTFFGGFAVGTRFPGRLPRPSCSASWVTIGSRRSPTRWSPRTSVRCNPAT